MGESGERFLVTGCGGFIGSHIVRRLLDDGVEVVGVDDFSTGKRENLEPVLDRMTFIEGSLCDPQIAKRACEGVTQILHQASIPSVPRSIADPLASLHSSATASVTLFMAAHEAGVKRVVQAASSSAYGNAETLPKVETMLTKPLSPYAAAKVAQEMYARAFSASFGLDTVSLRYFNVFGPRQDPKSQYAAVIPKFITMMLKGQAPTIFGDGTQSRDFTYIDNVVEGNLRAARASGPLGGEVINCACGGRFTLLELVERLNAILGTDLQPTFDQTRRGDVKHSQAGIEKAKELIGFEPVVDFDEGLRRTADYYRALASA